MALELGVDTFITLEDADEYISNTYTSDTEYYSKWNSLTDDDKSRWLRRSTNAINRIKFTVGKKKSLSQKLQFPRIRTNNQFAGPYSYNPWGISQFYDSTYISATDPNDCDDGLVDAGIACIENAVAGICYDKDAIDSYKERTVRGIASRRSGSYGESYNSPNNINKGINNDLWAYTKIKVILQSWCSSGALYF